MRQLAPVMIIMVMINLCLGFLMVFVASYFLQLKKSNLSNQEFILLKMKTTSNLYNLKWQ